MALKKYKKIIVTSVIYPVSAFFLFFIFINLWHLNFISAQSGADSADAIAIRVVANPNHYSALRWYNEKKFKGSPQSLTVDGYEAVRDGRTVYVNVANITAYNLYTNIYLISYNQQAENLTADIFSNILAHWKFNTNLSQYGHCHQSDNAICSSDLDCSLDDFCDSMKARVVRDTRRLADLSEMKILLDSYHNRGFYPKLSSGTYLPNKTLSVWPSWRETLADDLGKVLPVDPVNALGSCPTEYNKTTCWNEQAKEFVNSDWPNLPKNSLVYAYFTDTAGGISHLCSAFESGMSIRDLNVRSSLCPDICLDKDDDGYGINNSSTCLHPETDCNDTDRSVNYSTAPEAGNCNDGLDNDCDSLTDCDDSDCSSNPACTAISVYCGDNICNNGETNATCSQDCQLTCTSDLCNGNCPAGCSFSSQDPDCGGGGCCGDNTCNFFESYLTCSVDCPIQCNDMDGDYHIAENIDPSTCSSVCGPAHNQTCIGYNDCDDSNRDVHFGATELCDAIDNDCFNGADDGWTAETCQFLCLAPNNYDGSRSNILKCCGNDQYEGGPYQSPETDCMDGRDNDCDGFVDPADSDCSGLCSNIDESDHLGASTGCNQCGNSHDDDGNQTSPSYPTTEADWGVHVNMIDACDPACGPGRDLIDWSHFQQTETSCNDALDNDCDGDRNCDDSDCASAANCVFVCANGDTRPCGSDIGRCQAGTETCVAGAWSGTCAGEITPIAETCNGLDDNCNNQIDDGLVRPLNDIQFGVCAGSRKSCSGAGSWINDYSAVSNNEYPAELTCDNLDNNCNNIVDDGLTRACYTGPAATQGVGVCVGGNQACAAGSWGICAGQIIPGAEVCGNTSDEDCDGALDNGCINYCQFPITFPCVFP